MPQKKTPAKKAARTVKKSDARSKTPSSKKAISSKTDPALQKQKYLDGLLAHGDQKRAEREAGLSSGKEQEENRRRGGIFQPGQSGNPATQFKPGQSGNPGGRPRVSLTSTLRNLIEQQMPGASATYAHAIAEKICVKAALGDVRAATLIWDRLEGKATQPIDLSPSDRKRQLYLDLVERLSAKHNKPREQVIQDIIDRDPQASEYLR